MLEKELRKKLKKKKKNLLVYLFGIWGGKLLGNLLTGKGVKVTRWEHKRSET